MLINEMEEFKFYIFFDLIILTFIYCDNVKIFESYKI